MKNIFQSIASWFSGNAALTSSAIAAPSAAPAPIQKQTVKTPPPSKAAPSPKKAPAVALPPDPVMDEFEAQMNAVANVLGYTQEGMIQPIKQNGKMIGIWTKSFPDNAPRKRFLSMYIALLRRSDSSSYLEDFHLCISAGKYKINASARGEGYDVLVGY